MKNLILSGLIMLPFLMFSQSRSSIDFMFSPDLTYRILNNNGNDPTYSNIISVFDRVDKTDLNLHVGFNFNYKVSSSVSLKIGLEYAKLGTRSSLENAQWGNQNNNGTFDPNIPPEPNSPNFISNHVGYNIINLPLSVRYAFNNKKWQPYVELGVVPAYQMSRYYKSVYDNRKSFSTQVDYNKMAAFIHWGIGVNYQLNEKFQLFAQPTIRYQIITPNTPIKEHLYSIGIELGARMSP